MHVPVFYPPSSSHILSFLRTFAPKWNHHAQRTRRRLIPVRPQDNPELQQQCISPYVACSLIPASRKLLGTSTFLSRTVTACRRKPTGPSDGDKRRIDLPDERSHGSHLSDCADFFRRRSCILSPTFSEYADACRLHGHQVRSIYTTDHLPEDADIVWICNPNNPTGSVLPHDEMKRLAAQHPDVLFVIDQSYVRISPHACCFPHEAATRSNVILLHSLTKRFGIRECASAT